MNRQKSGILQLGAQDRSKRDYAPSKNGIEEIYTLICIFLCD